MKDIKACIMAGGKGTRLRPLTNDLPKPLVPLLGKPIIYYIIDLLKKNKINDAVISLGYQGERIQSEVSAKQYSDMEIDFATEDTPLGTAGGVKNAMKDFQGDILVISGDAMCDFDLAKAIEFHRLNASMATIITKQVEDPREYGLISSNEIGKINGFIEKPSYKSCSSDLASTGIYIISSKVLDFVKEQHAVDFAQDIFPMMLKQGYPLYAFEDKGYWCDVGDIKSYLQCQRDMLDKKVSFEIDAKEKNGVYYKQEILFADIKIEAPAFIGEGVTIGRGTVIEKYSVLGDHVTIGTSSTVSGSVLLPSTQVGNQSSLVNMICCSGAKLEDDTCAQEGSVIGSEAIVKKGASIHSGVKVWNNKTVLENISLKEDLQFGFAKDIIFDEEGIIGQTNITITPALCTKVGSGIASLQPKTVIGIGYSSHISSIALYYAVISGILAAGGTVWTFGECIESQFRFCLSKSLLEFGLYVDGGIVSTLKVYEKGAMPTSRAIERKLEGAINRSEYKRMNANQMGGVVGMQSLRELYQVELLKLCDTPIDGMQITIKTASKKIKHLMEDTLTKLGCEILEGDSKDKGLVITLTADGGSVSFACENHDYLFYEHILVLISLSEFLKGEDVSVSQTAPKMIDELAKIHGRTVYRYCDCPCSDDDKQARQKAIAKPYFRDGLMLTIKLLSFMKSQEIDYPDLLKLVPAFNLSSRMVSVSVSPSVIMKRLRCQKQMQSEGVVATKGGKTALIKPIKSGKGIMIYAESVSSEMAVEICDVFENIIKDTALDS